MAVDGNIHEGELASMQKHLDEHEMFAGLTERHHAVLLEIARDAIAFSDPIARIPAIAKGLPSRLHKLAALSMACEVVVADTFIDESEIRYLKLLRRALRLDSHDFETIFLAAREKRSAKELDGRLAHLRGLVPYIVELFALRSLSLAVLNPTHRTQVLDLLKALPDIEVDAEELTKLVERAYGRMHFALDIDAEIQKIASVMLSPADRYWSIVYLMCADTVNAPHWRNDRFLVSVQRAFNIEPADLDLAPGDAAGFAAVLPRVG